MAEHQRPTLPQIRRTLEEIKRKIDVIEHDHRSADDDEFLALYEHALAWELALSWVTGAFGRYSLPRGLTMITEYEPRET